MEVSLVDAVVYKFATALVSNARFRSICEAGSRRRGRFVFFDDLTLALTWFSEAVREHGETSLDKATAWTLHGCRMAIALRICELINTPIQASSDAALLSVPSSLGTIQLKRVEQFLTMNFPILQHYPNGSLAVSWAPSHDVQAPPIADGGHDMGGPPDFVIFSNFNPVRKILSSGQAFEVAYCRIKERFFPPPPVSIRHKLQKHILADGQSKSICCVIDWRVVEYLQTEHISSDNVDSIFTLSGELDSACACRLGDYADATWPTSSILVDMLRSLVAKLQFSASAKSVNDPVSVTSKGVHLDVFRQESGAKEQALAKISGQFTQICDIVEQLAWLTATLRPHVGGQLTISDVEFNVLELTDSKTSQVLYAPSIFRLSILSPDETLSPDASMPGQCWTSICPESVLAYGFPVLQQNRPKDAIGLEIPFGIMAAFAGVRYPVLLKDQVVFADSSTVLIPQTRLGTDSIQWHYVRSNNWLEKLVAEDAKASNSGLQTIDAADLTQSRSYLGYCTNSEVLMGTADFEHLDVPDSGVPRSSKAQFQLSGDMLRIIPDNTGKATTPDGTVWKFNRGESALIRASNLNPEERCLQSARCSTLLYDQISHNAFIISELSLIVQLTTVYLREHSQMKRMHIPLAEIAADGGEAALQVFKRAKHQLIPLFQGGSRKYSEIVEDFLDIVEQRKIQTSLRVRLGGVTSRAGLKGWDHSDLQAKNFELWERELRVGEREIQPLWWDIFQDSKPLVLFTRLPKPPIRNSLTDSKDGTYICRAWDTLPTDKPHHLLVISVPQLEHLRADTCANPRVHSTLYTFNDSIAWARPTQSRLFEHICRDGGSCTPFQTFVDLTSKRRRLPQGWDDESSYYHHPGEMAPNGAIVFADDPGSFEPRNCRWKSRSRLASGKEWNYPFIGVSVVVLGLAYWNFWFFVLVLVLFGLAYVLK